MSNRKPYRPDPEALAISALAWLAADGERIGRFLSLTGLEPGDLRSAASEPGFLGAVLDHLLADDANLQAFAADQGIDPATVSIARRALPGDIHSS